MSHATALEFSSITANQMFNAAIVPLLIPALRAFTPPYPKLSSTSSFAQPSPLRTTLLQADFDSLEESCMFLESLSLDVEDFRLSLARGLHFPAEHDGVPCLSSMLSFVEKGDYPPLWYETGSPDPKNNEKAFDICKAAMIKAIVEVSGEEKNADVLWDDCEPGRPGGDFVCRMVDWIRKYVVENSGAAHPLPQNGVVERQGRHVLRDDMAICATLSLGNLARRGECFTPIIFTRFKHPRPFTQRSTAAPCSCPRTPLAPCSHHRGF
jgi:hypothetical protein